MEWMPFHHPDISWPVIRRRAGIEMMECLELAALFFSRGGWAVVNRSCYPNRAAYRNAVSRLQKKGLVVRRTDGPETPQLMLTDIAKETLPVYFNPEKEWKRKWSGVWYLMTYDVPEVDKCYRNVLRQFLKRMRMGQLHKSVWVVPRDIRPEYDDLCEAAGVAGFSFLFESRTVLGLPERCIVSAVWNFERLEQIQRRYCDVASQNIDRLKSSDCGREELARLARMALDAYHAAFAEDPLLPSALLPRGYLGKEVFRMHRELYALLTARLDGVSSR